MTYISLPPSVSYPSPYAQHSAFRPGIVHGLGVDLATTSNLQAQFRQQLNQALNQVRAKMGEGMKKAMVKSAAAQTVITTSAAAIPVVGWAAGAIAAVVAGIAGSKYQNEAKAILADAENKLAILMAQSERRINDMINKVVDAEMPAAMRLALSGQPLNGLHGLYGWNPVKDIKKAAEKVGREVKRAADDVSDFMQEEVYDVATGRVAKVEARKQRDRILREGKKMLQDQEQKIAQILRHPDMRAQLRKEIAQVLIQDPNVQSVIQRFSAAGVDTTMSSGLDAKALAVPAVAAGAVILASLAL